jgi:hypothetical protein
MYIFTMIVTHEFFFKKNIVCGLYENDKTSK